MRRYTGLSGLALMAALGLTFPAQAQLLNLGGGGGGLVNLGGSGNGGATVTVGGGSGSVLSVDTGGGASTGGGTSGGIDLGGVIGDGGGSASSGGIDLGSILGSGDAGSDNLVNLHDTGEGISLGLLDDNGVVDLGLPSGGTGDVTGDDILDSLFGTGSPLGGTIADVDLSGGSSDPNDITVGIGDNDALAVVDLFGNGSGLPAGDGLDLGNVLGDGSAINLGDILGNTAGAGAGGVVDLGLPGGGGAGGVPDSDVLGGLFGPGSVLGGTVADVDLSGGTSDPNDITVGIGDNDALAVVDLSGAGGLLSGGLPTLPSSGSVPGLPTGGTGATGGPDISVDLNGNDGGTPEVAVDLLGTDVAIDLFGAGGAPVPPGTPDPAPPTLTPVPPAGGPSAGGNPTDIADDGGVIPGDDASGGVNGTGANGQGLAPTRAAVRVAAAGNAGARCFSPSGQQVQYLLNSRDYDASMSASWSTSDAIDIVPVSLCPAARARVEAAIDRDPDIQWLQAAVSRNARLGSVLRSGGHDGEDVLALDDTGNRIRIYVF